MVDFSFTAVFRGTPLLVRLLLRYNLALFVPHMTPGIPGTGWTHTWDTNSVITGFASAPRRAPPVRVPQAHLPEPDREGSGAVNPRLADAGAAPLVKAVDVHKRYGDNQVLKGVGPQVRKGEIVALIGPSGSGRTTFLRRIDFLERYQNRFR